MQLDSYDHAELARVMQDWPHLARDLRMAIGRLSS